MKKCLPFLIILHKYKLSLMLYHIIFIYYIVRNSMSFEYFQKFIIIENNYNIIILVLNFIQYTHWYYNNYLRFDYNLLINIIFTFYLIP